MPQQRAYCPQAIASFAQGLAACGAATVWIRGAVSQRPWLPAGIASCLLGLGAVAAGIWALRRLSSAPELRGKVLAIAGIAMGAAPLLTLI